MKEEMRMTFVNVGYGEAILLECPDPSRPAGVFVMVIDGGSGESEEYQNRSTGRMPLTEYLAARDLSHVDVVVATHIHEDHLCGLLPLLTRWRPQEFWQTLPEGMYRALHPLRPLPDAAASLRPFRKSMEDYQTLCAQTVSGGGILRTLSAGWTLQPCPHLTVRCLGPSPSRAAELAAAYWDLDGEEDPDIFLRKLDALDGAMNNYSCVLLLDYQGTRILLPGDASYTGYQDIAAEDLQAHIFKVGHHGQRDGVDAALAAAIHPKAVVCCASSDRRYQSAHPETLQILQEVGAALYFSDCPSLPDIAIPPHQALVFTIGAGGTFTAEYIAQKGKICHAFTTI